MNFRYQYFTHCLIFKKIRKSKENFFQNQNYCCMLLYFGEIIAAFLKQSQTPSQIKIKIVVAFSCVGYYTIRCIKNQNELFDSMRIYYFF